MFKFLKLKNLTCQVSLGDTDIFLVGVLTVSALLVFFFFFVFFFGSSSFGFFSFFAFLVCGVNDFGGFTKEGRLVLVDDCVVGF